MERTVRWIKGERFTRSMRIKVAAPSTKVFPLLCPVREYEWIPDWSCVMIYSESGVAEKDAMFTTVEKPFGKVLWTCIHYEPPKRVDYLLAFGTKAAIRLELELTDGDAGCEITWTMRFTAASRFLGSLLSRHMSETAFLKMIKRRERQLAEFFSA